MAGFLPGDFRFLYRTDQGRLDRAGWLAGATPLALVAVLGGALAAIAAPYAHRSLAERAFYDPLSFATNLYLLVYAFAMILIAISWTNLSAKRFRDRGRHAPLGLAGLLPLAILLSGAAHWLQPRVAEVLPRWTVTACDGLLVLVAVWTAAELFDLIPKAKSE